MDEGRVSRGHDEDPPPDADQAVPGLEGRDERAENHARQGHTGAQSHGEAHQGPAVGQGEQFGVLSHVVSIHGCQGKLFLPKLDFSEYKIDFSFFLQRAYRLEEPDPRFQNPYLPQWTKLFKEITLSRVKKKRSHEAGHRLTEGRAFKIWKYLMSVDRCVCCAVLYVSSLKGY